MKRTAKAHWTGNLKDGKGDLTPQSGLLSRANYSFKTRFEGGEKGTNPEELLAAAHAGCFTMAVSFALTEKGFNPASLDTEAIVSMEGLNITSVHLAITGEVSGINKVYVYCTLAASLTALGLSKQGGFNPGHVFALFIVILTMAAYFLYAKKQGNSRARLFENFLLSFSFLLSLVPTVNETVTRLPVGHPWADGPADPVIGKTLLVLFLLFIVGSVYQFRMQTKRNKSTNRGIR